MLSNEKTVKWLLKHRVDEFGNVNLSGLDFTSVNCSVWFSKIKVTGSLYQDEQKVGGDLYQHGQKVGGNLLQSYQNVKGDLDQDHQIVDKNLYQSCQVVKGNLEQCAQSVKGDLISHKLPVWEHWEDYFHAKYLKYDINGAVIRKKMLKPITKEELKKMGYELKEN